ncbi:MAG: hypothetical protein MJ231_07315 [bacterium]|nr:hypothetical protein [bacterium]
MAQAKNNVDNTAELEALKAELEAVKAEKEKLAKANEELKSKSVNSKGAYKKGSFIVYTPVKNFNGTVAGVQFAYGKANVQKGWVLDWFAERGYKVEEVK